VLGIAEEDDAVQPDRGNVVDLMAALKKSLSQSTEAPAAKRPARKVAPKKPAAQRGQASKPARKRA
jgi:non-homologous end joining protein Ku